MFAAKLNVVFGKNSRFSLRRFCTVLQSDISQNPGCKIENIVLENTKLLRVAIIGMPNAGKSTLINNLTERTVCGTSKKVHTTRNRTSAIKNISSTQLVFLDTPGIVSSTEKKKFNLEKSFVSDSSKCLKEADIVGVIHDVSNIWTRNMLDKKLIHLLQEYDMKNTFLVLNKVDTLKSKRILLDIIKNVTENSLNNKKIAETKNKQKGWRNFNEIFMVSALTGDGVNDIKDYLVRQSQPAKWLYEKEKWTDETPENIVVNITKATFLDFLPQEIPYKLKTQLEYFQMSDEGMINAVVLVECLNQRIKNLIVGLGDGKLRQIIEKTQKDLMGAFKMPVRIKIVVQTPKSSENK